MKKGIFGLILVIILAIAAGTYYLLSNLDTLVKSVIESQGSAVTHTAVRVKKVQIKLTEGLGTIKGLTIANPDGFETAYAFSLGEITTGIDIKSLKQQPYVISEITVRKPQVFVEVNADNKTNLNELKKTIIGTTPNTKPGVEKKASASNSDSKATEPRLIIRRLVFADGEIKVKLIPLDNKEYKLKLSNFKMTGLGGKNGATPAELTKEIMNRLIDHAKKDVKRKGIDVELDKLKAELDSKVEQEKAKLKSKSDDKLNKEKQKLKNKLKGLLN
ncbi:MAG: hypothetical protein ACC657_17025 [Thiohalomonadales bacterium]